MVPEPFNISIGVRGIAPNESLNLELGDFSVPIRLDDLVTKEKDMGLMVFGSLYQMFLSSQIERGSFIHDGPQAYDEVLQEDRRAIPGQKPGGGKSKDLARE